MNASGATAQQIEELIEEVGRKHPHSSNILQAYGPILIEKSRIMATVDLPEIDTKGIDTVRLQSGVPVMQQAALLLPADPWKHMALTLLPAMQKGLPAIAAEIDTLKRCIESGAIDLAGYFCAGADRCDSVLAAWEKTAGINLPVCCLLLETLARIVLEKRACGMSAFIKEKTWNKGYCPVCGNLPGLSIIHEKVPDRWLHCTGCGHEWRFSRVLCPCCEAPAKEEGMSYFFVEGKDTEAAFICEACKKYLITLNRVDNPGEKDVEILAMGMAHLDISMQEKGYSPMKSCFWNNVQ
jgi:FdhE protein